MNDEILQILLRDQTTLRNIIWATSDRSTQEITIDDVENIVPRWEKNRAEQKFRTKSRAEIFTPPEVCKTQNNLVIGDTSDFEKFIDARFLEITCGEAPYITSRYNAVTGEPIEFNQRVGILDRKLQLINKDIDLTRRAVKSVYGYEFQGDNLFLARRNIFDTVAEFVYDKAPAKELKNFLIEVANIISWNFWQMDGLSKNYSPPFTNSNPQTEFNFYGNQPKPQDKIFCQIMNWQTNKPVIFKSLIGGARR